MRFHNFLAFAKVVGGIPHKMYQFSKMPARSAKNLDFSSNFQHLNHFFIFFTQYFPKFPEISGGRPKDLSFTIRFRDPPPTNLKSPHDPPSRRSVSDIIVISASEEENMYIEENMKIQYPCTVCSLRETTHSCIPCGHFSVCQRCIDSYQIYNIDIPVLYFTLLYLCRNHLEGWLRTYLPH